MENIEIIGKSPAIKKIITLAHKVAPTDSTILITGETGTGKELIAKTIHKLSKRSNGPFIAINCGAIPENLLESELFGHKKGSFTGAITDRKGLFEEGNNGTVFLDELAEMSPSLQVKLLRVSENGEIRRVGDNEINSVNVRIIAATNKDLWQEVQKNKFREDLFFRLSVIHLHIPPLRDRKEDINPLIRHILDKANIKNSKNIISFTDEALAILHNYTYPGNVRELENIIYRAVILTETDVITKDELPYHIYSKVPKLMPPDDLKDFATLEDLEKRMIEYTLTKCEGNQIETATKLGISRTTLWRKMRKYGIVS